MFEPEFIKYLTTLGVGGAIAGLMFFFYRKDVKVYTEQWKGQSELMVKVVQQSTEALTSNTEVMREVSHSLGHVACLNLDHDHDRNNRELPSGIERRSVPRR